MILETPRYNALHRAEPGTRVATTVDGVEGWMMCTRLTAAEIFAPQPLNGIPLGTAQELPYPPGLDYKRTFVHGLSYRVRVRKRRSRRWHPDTGFGE